MVDQEYLDLAFSEARKGDATWTNPQVGAVIVKNGEILAQGHHEKFGGPHAEINTLNNLKNINDAKNATMYVTLEPCSHFGKTPPCVKRVVDVGIKRVVIGQQDPNPIVSGNGIRYLKDHGVNVTVFDQDGDINQAYQFFYKNKRPLITLKYAMTLDGKINQHAGIRSLITDQEAYHDAQKLRMNNQAILVGEHTLEIDDPQLTVRDQNLDFPPIRLAVVHDINLADRNLKLFEKNQSDVYFLSQMPANFSLPDNVFVEVEDVWTPEKIAKFLADKNIESLLVEGGSRLQAEFVKAGLVDQVVAYVAPKIFGGDGLPAISADLKASDLKFSPLEVSQMGPDIKIETWRL